MSKNVLFCAVGLALGFVIGFFIANAITRPAAPVAAPRASSDGVARPLDPSQTSGELPPGHPDVGGGGSIGSGSPASTSAEAQAAMDKADRSPQDFEAQVGAANVFYRMGDYGKSALYFERALKLKPKDFGALVGMGNAKYDADDFTAAAGFYERALAVKPDSPDVRTDYGNTFFMRQPPDYARAIAEYRKSVAIDPNHVNSWKNVAAAALRLKDREVAGEAIEKLAALDPQNPDLPALRQSLNDVR